MRNYTWDRETDTITPIEDDDLFTMAQEFEKDRKVDRYSEFEDCDCFVSTVFLVLNHNFDNSKPIVFETMSFLFGDEWRMQRYSKPSDARYGHIAHVEEFRELLDKIASQGSTRRIKAYIKKEDPYFLRNLYSIRANAPKLIHKYRKSKR